MNRIIGKRITMNGGLNGNDWLPKTRKLVFQSIFDIFPKKSIENWLEFGLKNVQKRDPIRIGSVQIDPIK